jgi:hypothetical protein
VIEAVVVETLETAPPDATHWSTCQRWAFCAITTSPGARAFYNQCRQNGDTHQHALRALANRLVGLLHGCLRHHTPYDEHTA